MDNSNIVDIESLLPHRVSMVICLKCYKRWIAVRPDKTKLVDMDLSVCG